MTIVEYLANIWKTLFSPMQYFEMDDAGKMELYFSELEKPSEVRSEDITRQGKIAWMSVVDKAIVSKRTPRMEMLTSGIMKQLGSMKAHSMTKLLVGALDENDDHWKKYRTVITDILNDDLIAIPFEEPEQRQVTMNFAKKLEWVMAYHSDLHYQRPLPLLTPEVILSLVQCMEMIPNALLEVSTNY
jgi:hypothetical protein